ncbi:hypothetical protein VAR608DRAFT_2947 [Variovorax sp. HW608]|uniref:hypothetical protein n=1 Tax=Variovorax sp. HW608 TaxID=1034889 RepID=UPI00081FEE1C|nr:hypothetical protein [Variovorax sp. HW608]SCK33335.1 hypothetical protein VAR608DRAFT_2947 [Variovorax sp. HW608]
MLEIGGATTQAGTGRRVVYQVKYSLAEDSQGARSGRIALARGEWHALTGGFPVNITSHTIEAVVRQAMSSEIDDLDMEALERSR